MSSVTPYSIPFRRWPLQRHISAAALVVGLVAATLHFGNAMLSHARQQRAAELVELQRSNVSQQKLPAAPIPDFRTHLPAAASTDAMLRDIFQYAEQRGVVLGTVAQQPGVINTGDIRSLQVNVTASADYPSFKLWLADILGRYPSLAVQQMGIRSSTNDKSRTDIVISLLFAHRN